MALPVELDDYIQETVDSAIGLTSSQKLNREAMTEQKLQQKVCLLGEQLQEAQAKFDKIKGESTLNAQALKKYVVENQRLKEHINYLCQEGTRIERECALYIHDRDVFMEAADEAEDRANQAESQLTLTNQKIHDLSSQIDDINAKLTEYMATNEKMGKEMTCLQDKVKEVEILNQSLQNEKALVEKREANPSENDRIEQLERENKRLRAYLEIEDSNDGDEHFVERKIRKMDGDGIFSRPAFAFISSVIEDVLTHTTEQEKEKAISKIHSKIEKYMGGFESELLGRLETSEKTVCLLQAEVLSLNRDKNDLKNNLEKAEDEVQLLGDQNTELRLLLGGKCHSPESCASPIPTRVKSSCSPSPSPSSTPSKQRKIDGCGCDATRQPLTPIAQNHIESRIHCR